MATTRAAASEASETPDIVSQSNDFYDDPDPVARCLFKEDCRYYNHVERSGSCIGVDLSTSGSYMTEAPRNGEITWSQMTEDEKLKFQASDLAEWKSLEEEFKAVKVWKGEDAAHLREVYRDRIMTSRMVRRRKPMPGLHQYKAKSRFCVHGHKDPDSGTFRTFAPTPSTEALHVVCQVIANHGMTVNFGDIKAAFAQSDKLLRPQGRLFPWILSLSARSLCVRAPLRRPAGCPLSCGGG